MSENLISRMSGMSHIQFKDRESYVADDKSPVPITVERVGSKIVVKTSDNETIDLAIEFDASDKGERGTYELKWLNSPKEDSISGELTAAKDGGQVKLTLKRGTQDWFLLSRQRV